MHYTMTTTTFDPTKILQMPCANRWAGRGGYKPRYIINHGTAGGMFAQDTARYFIETQTLPDDERVSAHFIIGTDGFIVESVSVADSAWANGVLTAGHAPWWNENINPNLTTISIEHCKPDTQNVSALTPEQQAASFALNYWLCKTYNIPMHDADATGGITGHFSIDPVYRSQCPGNYPWAALWTYLNQPTPSSQPLPLWLKYTTGGHKPMPLNAAMLKDATQEFSLFGDDLYKGVPLKNQLNFNSGIAAGWKDMYSAGLRMGPATSPEHSSNDWGEKPLIVQQFQHARCEWENGKDRWFGAYGEIIKPK